MLAGVGIGVGVGACAPEVLPAPAPEVFVTRASVADDELEGFLADERAVVEALLQFECPMRREKLWPNASQVVIALETDPALLNGCLFTDEKLMNDVWRTNRARTPCPVSLAMLNAFAAVSHVPSTIPDGLQLPCPVVVAPRAVLDAFRADGMPGWDRLRAAFCSDGHIALSPVLFDATRSVALVARGHWTGTMAGGSELVVFRRQPSGWIMEAYRLLSFA